MDPKYYIELNGNKRKPKNIKKKRRSQTKREK